jgi:hypothetical protein
MHALVEYETSQQAEKAVSIKLTAPRTAHFSENSDIIGSSMKLKRLMGVEMYLYFIFLSG